MPTALKKRSGLFKAALLFGVALALCSCADLEKPRVEPFISVTKPPAKQEFRWSNGKAPKSFDPARAAAAPETDIVRALFQGLTEIDSKTMQAIPGVAEKWTSSEDLRTWTFQLRKDAKWSNGKRVTADDFVSSWKRVATLGGKAAHRELFQNIVGLKPEAPPTAPPVDQSAAPHSSSRPNVIDSDDFVSQQLNSQPPGEQKHVVQEGGKPVEKKIGVEAVGDLTLKVTLELPDKDLPKLVADTAFRPVYGDGAEFETAPLDVGVVTNGAFTVSEAAKDGVSLKRSETFWNKGTVKLERIRFVPKENGEAALDAYKKGEVDAVTNADFEPLALKLLNPYEDFRQTTHNALNLYEVNTKVAPFSDRRVREALAISIDRESLSNGELEGATQPATTFLPVSGDQRTGILLDVARARDLLEKAGYPRSDGFPTIRLVVNRNDIQQRVARAVARMWKQNLNLNTQVIVKESAEMLAVRTSGEYDLIRRGVVLPSVDELADLTSIFGNVIKPPKTTEQVPSITELDAPEQNEKRRGPAAGEISEERIEPPVEVITEEEALFEFNAIPLYFPTSYSLVKPYVRGFESNSIDVINIDQVEIDNNWQPDRPRSES